MTKPLNNRFSPHPLRLAIFNAVPGWRRLRHLHQVPDLPGEFILTLSRVLAAVHQSALTRHLRMHGVHPFQPAGK